MNRYVWITTPAISETAVNAGYSRVPRWGTLEGFASTVCLFASSILRVGAHQYRAVFFRGVVTTNQPVTHGPLVLGTQTELAPRPAALSPIGLAPGFQWSFTVFP